MDIHVIICNGDTPLRVMRFAIAYLYSGLFKIMTSYMQILVNVQLILCR